MQDTCSRVHSHGHAPAGCMQGACLACLVLAVRAHRERLRVCLQLARLRARNARAHTVTCAYALRFLPSVRCLCARPQCGVLSPRARQTTSFTCWSVVSLYRILSRFSFDSSSSSSSGSNVSSTKSAAPACPAVAAPAERSAADRTPAAPTAKPAAWRTHAAPARGAAPRPLRAAPWSWKESVLGASDRARSSRRPAQHHPRAKLSRGDGATTMRGGVRAVHVASRPHTPPRTPPAPRIACRTHATLRPSHNSPLPAPAHAGPRVLAGFATRVSRPSAGTRDVTNHNALSVL